eukprot:SM000169S02738  [mRNA]  locus=s169:212476:212687:+ [translate_table: standard]
MGGKEKPAQKGTNRVNSAERKKKWLSQWGQGLRSGTPNGGKGCEKPARKELTRFEGAYELRSDCGA